MLAQPNHANLVYDGDFSDSTPPATASDVNPGADRIEKELQDCFASVGVPIEPTGFDGRSDHKAFQDAGLAAGGPVLRGRGRHDRGAAPEVGGTAEAPFDSCYHKACDNIGNLDMVGAETLADGGAHVLAVLAEDPNVRATLNSGGGAAPRSFAKAKRPPSGRVARSRTE